MKPEYRNLIYLASCAVNGQAPQKSIVETMDLDALEKAASFHKMETIAAYGLTDSGIQTPFCTEAIDGEVRKVILTGLEREAVCQALSDANIWYMPLKGTVLKEYYPRIGMRQMSDTDILFDSQRAEDVRNIMESLGFETVLYGRGHHDDYQKSSFFHFEMHRALFSDTGRDDLYSYFKDVEKRLLAQGGQERRFSDEDFYLYMVSHAFKHFYWNGIGLRSLLDLYVFLEKKRKSLDWNYINTELSMLRMEGFEKKNRELAEKVFSSGDLSALSPEELDLLEVYASSGMYGTIDRSVQIGVDQVGKWRYLVQRIFPPMDHVKKNFPFFYQHKVLLPLLPFYRFAMGWEKAKKEWAALRKMR